MKYYLTAALVIASDQVSKAVIRMTMHVGDSISILGDFFRLTYIRNSGAAFSMMSGQRLLLVVIPIAGIVAALWYLHRHRGEHWTLYALSLIHIYLSGSVYQLLELQQRQNQRGYRI